MNRDTIEPVTWEGDRIDAPDDSGFVFKAPTDAHEQINNGGRGER